MLIVVLLVGLLALWIWSLVKMPSKRAREIFDAHGPAPSDVSDRDRAFVLDLHRHFGTRDFTYKTIADRPLDPQIAGAFGVESASLDDREELGVRLPQLKLLVSFEPGRYRLTEEAALMAERLGSEQSSLENSHHG
ncbi:hypothetical protein [Henriciella sp.]|uniref:hypothetical protein n=1 Tax=Henriciella sp. TaxID=1968823 RepID=UPI00262D1E90|nr:hypothetical protein [Henriciella sp.]